MQKKNEIKKSHLLLIFLTTILFSYMFLIFPIIYKENNYEKIEIINNIFMNFNEFIVFKKLETNKSVSIANDALLNKFRFNQKFNFNAINDLEKAWKTSLKKIPFLNYGFQYDNNSHELQVQSLEILYDLIVAHKSNQNDLYLKKGIEIIKSWINNNTRFSPFQSIMLWNDHATSNRITAILIFYDYATQHILFSENEISLINDITKKSIAYLASEYNYTKNHNHGIFEDLALLICSIHLSDDALKKKYSEIAIKRFSSQIIGTYDSSGVHLENSPGYHIVITELINQFIHLVELYHLSLDSEIIKIVDYANKNKFYFVLNNGRYPPVGDTPYKICDYFIKKTDNPVLISQDGGFVVYKENEFYLLIRTQSILENHAHDDQLSFIYEVNNDLIISEAGFLDYTNSENNKFVHSEVAHNKINFEDRKKRSLFYFSNTLNNNEIFYCKVISQEGNISREFLLDKKLKILFVNDTINNILKPCNEILNFGIDIKDIKKISNLLNIIMANGNNYYTASFLSNDLIYSEIYFGSQKPRYGWHAKEFSGLEPSYTIVTSLPLQEKLNFIRVVAEMPVKTLLKVGDKINLTLNDNNQSQYDINYFNKNSNHHLMINTNKKPGFLSTTTSFFLKKISTNYCKRIKMFTIETVFIIFLFSFFLLIKKLHFYLVIIPVIFINMINSLIWICI